MASIEQRGKKFRLVFRFNVTKRFVNLKSQDLRDAERRRARLEDNLILVGRCRLEWISRGSSV